MTPLLGDVEARLFEQGVQDVIEALKKWERGWTSISYQWSQQTAHHTERRESMFKMMLEIENPAIRAQILQVFWSSELQVLHNELGEDGGWLSRYQLLKWAAEKTASLNKQNNEQAQWLQLLEEEWLTLMEEAKRDNAVYRVTRLVKNSDLADVRQQPRAQQCLMELKSWCFERYSLYQAWQCNQQIQDKMSNSFPFIKTIGEYGSNFAKVWLALLVGVILIFDFGEPWFELAEKGDVGGVLFTFCFGLAGTFLYIWVDLRKKVAPLGEEALSWLDTGGRIIFFLSITFVYTFGVVCLFWYMFSGTNQVVHGVHTPLYLLSWTGFALFVGVFLGLIGK